ncbi:ClpP/crotonase-like domain-containing protein [Mycena epipterygia]|nr:ClpP/crotonase-like domain-containing protein [Mycena epipterygia]
MSALPSSPLPSRNYSPRGLIVRVSSIYHLFTYTANFDYIHKVTDAAGITAGGLTGSFVADGTRKSLSLLRDVKEFQHAISAPERCPFPVIVVIHGLVLGLGVDIISACDIRYAAEDPRFKLNIGLAADIGSLAYLPKITANHSFMRELAYSAAIFSAKDAERLGLVSCIVPHSSGERG